MQILDHNRGRLGVCFLVGLRCNPRTNWTLDSRNRALRVTHGLRRSPVDSVFTHIGVHWENGAGYETEMAWAASILRSRLLGESAGRLARRLRLLRNR